MVSVPFRGSCSEMNLEKVRKLLLLKKFPSPFGVRVLKCLWSLPDNASSAVSVPFRGSCSEILVLQALILRGFKMPFAARIVFLSLSCAISLKKCASSLVIADAARISLTV